MIRSTGFSRRGWMIVAAGFTLMGLGTGLSFTFGVFLKPLAQDFGWTRSEISLAYSLNMLVLGAFSFVMGTLSDRWGAARVLLIGSVIMALGMYLTSRISAIWQLYVFYGFLIGMGKASYHTPVMAYVARIFNRRRGLAVGLIFSGTGVGLFALAPLTRYLISNLGWRLTFVVMAAGFLVLTVPTIWLFRERRGQAVDNGEEKAGEHSPSDGTPAAAPAEPAAPERFHWRNRSFGVLCGLHYFDCVSHSVPLVHVVAYATDRGLTPGQGAGVLGVAGLAAVVGRVIIPALTDRIGSRRGLLLTLILQTGMIPFLMISDSLLMFYIFAVIFGFGWGGNSPMYPLLTREYFGPKRLGTIYGGTIVASSVGMAAGGYMGGLLFDASGSYQYSLLFSLTAGLISIALLPLLKPLRVKKERGAVFRAAPAPAPIES